jgi:hypothetical protein
MPPIISIFSFTVILARIDSTRLSTSAFEDAVCAIPSHAYKRSAIAVASLFVMVMVQGSWNFCGSCFDLRRAAARQMEKLISIFLAKVSIETLPLPRRADCS